VETCDVNSCAACRGELPALTPHEIRELRARLHGEWRVRRGKTPSLAREWRFPDFRQALAFTTRVGEIADALGHHPEVHLSWGKACITLWTYKVQGLTVTDFDMAAMIDRMVESFGDIGRTA
jgi:4a-hydroxytetrahydrobiopterin dehydratase